LSAIAFGRLKTWRTFYFSFDFGADEEKAQQARQQTGNVEAGVPAGQGKCFTSFERESDAEAPADQGAEKLVKKPRERREPGQDPRRPPSPSLATKKKKEPADGEGDAPDRQRETLFAAGIFRA